jgi:auxin influx carrier (AUX1 LAX family)
MATDKVVETVMVGNYVEMETEGKPKDLKARFSKFLWHGGSAYDAWFSCASNQVNFLYSLQSFFHSYRKLLLFLTSLLVFSCFFSQVAQVLLTLPYSFSQLGMLSGICFQLFYGLLGSWTAYLISVLYVEYRTRKEREKVDFRNHVIQVS